MSRELIPLTLSGGADYPPGGLTLTDDDDDEEFNADMAYVCRWTNPDR